MEILKPLSYHHNMGSNWAAIGGGEGSRSGAPAIWTPAENKVFENALAVYDGDTPDRWLKVVAMIPGKTVADVIRQYKELEDDASRIEDVSMSTFKRLCRDYQISRWPPRKKNLDQSRSGNFAQTDSTKELREPLTIKAKYGDIFIKFKLSASSGINAFNQQVSMRRKLETGSYVVKYQDDDNDWILVACDDDPQDYISSSASSGKTTLTVLLEHI